MVFVCIADSQEGLMVLTHHLVVLDIVKFFECLCAIIGQEGQRRHVKNDLFDEKRVVIIGRFVNGSNNSVNKITLLK